jgi:hypothetical protein
MGLETEWFIDMTWRFTRYDNFLGYNWQHGAGLDKAFDWGAMIID